MTYIVHIPSDWLLDSYSVEADSKEQAIELAEEGQGEHVAQQALTYPIADSWAEEE